MHIERIEPNTKEWNLYYGNHIYRYKFALEQIKKKKVASILDIATGVGYGTNYLATNGAFHLTGVDIDDQALTVAKQNFSSNNIEFIKEDCNDLKKVNKIQYDAIVSFETLEHLKNYKSFTKELFKMLHDDGTLIISTPNILVTEHHTKDDWHFHEKEFTPSEFIELLKSAGFKNIELYGQKYSPIGELRNDLRHEINILRSNPFSRIGMWFQSKLKRRKFEFPLPEREVDFEIERNSVEYYSNQKKNGPFVLIAVCQKV